MNSQEQSPNDITKKTAQESLPEKWKDIGIYGLRNKINGKWYVGQTINPIGDRMEDYKNLRCKSQRKLYRALKKYGYEQFEKIVLEVCEPIKSVLNEREDHWIEHLDSIKNGYNIRQGGTSGALSSETRLKMSLAHRGKKFTQAHRNKLSEAARNRPKFFHTPETIEKMKLRKGINLGSKNGNYGKRWITNGKESLLTSETNPPLGWQFGHSHHNKNHQSSHFMP